MTEPIRAKLAKAIRNTEFEGRVYLAGGCVRDELLGKPTNDFDIAVELPEGGIRLAEFLHKHKMASKPTIYKQFGTALVYLGKDKIELVMTRKESYRSRSRKPEVAFGTLMEDVLRRDFTINSLLKSVSEGKVIDLCGKGLKDLQSGIIRATSNPDVIFKEDPLRLLRAIRFAVELDFNIEKQTFSYIKQHSGELKHISKERITDEFIRIIQHPNYLKGIYLLKKSGLMASIFQGLRTSALLNLPLPALLKSASIEWMKTALQEISFHARIALLIWSAKDPELQLQQLKLALQDRRHILTLVYHCKTIRKNAKKGFLQTPAQLLKAADEINSLLDEFTNIYPLAGTFYNKGKADFETDQALCRKIRTSAYKLADYRFNLTGDDLIRTFCIKGAKIGLMLDRARDYWYEHPQATKEEILQFLQAKFAGKV